MNGWIIINKSGLIYPRHLPSKKVLVNMQYPNSKCMRMIFTGTAYVLNLLGGAIADSVTKRIHVILAALVFYILGK